MESEVDIMNFCVNILPQIQVYFHWFLPDLQMLCSVGYS